MSLFDLHDLVDDGELEELYGAQSDAYAGRRGHVTSWIVYLRRDLLARRHALARPCWSFVVDITEPSAPSRRSPHGAPRRADRPGQSGLSCSRMEDMLSESGAAKGLAILCIDLDDFKAVNDTLGHPAGDAAARRGATALRDARDGDIVARLGGDEFVILQAMLTPMRQPASRSA